MNQAEYYKITLPGEKLYPEGTLVEIKKITPFEQKKFFSDMMVAEESEKNSVMIDFVKTLVRCTGINFEDIYYPDLQFILYQIRTATYKLFPLKFYYTCEGCKQKQTVTIDTEKLEITEPPADMPTTILLDNHGEVAIRYKTIADDKRIDNFLKSKGLKSDDILMRVLVMDMLLLDRWQPLEETWNLATIGDITAQDTTRIENFIGQNAWGVKEEVTCKCQKCGKEVAVSYNMDPADFFSANNN
jgi:hypothetical protein